jgi:NAD(P)-dependent dehydrogenase (short-subunit alcohol dehydrogenase family)
LKTILITGGAGGIATAIAEALVARGDRVVVFDRTEPRVATSWENVDVTDEIGLELALNRVRSVHARIDGIVCAAGVVSESPLAQMTLDEWRRVVDISLTGTFLALRAVLPAMIEAKSGKIVAFSSGYGRKGYKFGAHYAAAKAGIEALVKSTERDRTGTDRNAVSRASRGSGPLRTHRANDPDGPHRRTRRCSWSGAILSRPEQRLHHRPSVARKRRLPHAVRVTALFAKPLSVSTLPMSFARACIAGSR